jgi:hypothetical protein
MLIKQLYLICLFYKLLKVHLGLPFEYDVFDDLEPEEERITFPRGNPDLSQRIHIDTDMEFLEDSFMDKVLRNQEQQQQDAKSKVFNDFKFSELNMLQASSNASGNNPNTTATKNNTVTKRKSMMASSNNSANTSVQASSTSSNTSNTTINNTSGKSCFNWKRVNFSDVNGNGTIVPFKTCGGGSKKVHGYVTGEEIVFFHEVRGENWKPCHSELYALSRENTTSIRIVPHGISPELDSKEGLYSSYDEDFRQIIYKLMADAEFRMQIYKICENRKDAKLIYDIGWVPVKLSREKPVKKITIPMTYKKYS